MSQPAALTYILLLMCICLLFYKYEMHVSAILSVYPSFQACACICACVLKVFVRSLCRYMSSGSQLCEDYACFWAHETTAC